MGREEPMTLTTDQIKAYMGLGERFRDPSLSWNTDWYHDHLGSFAACPSPEDADAIAERLMIASMLVGLRKELAKDDSGPEIATLYDGTVAVFDSRHGNEIGRGPDDFSALLSACIAVEKENDKT